MISRSLSAFLWRFFRRTRKPPADIVRLQREAQRARARHKATKAFEEQMRAARVTGLRREVRS